jgi:hypothetical protein
VPAASPRSSARRIPHSCASLRSAARVGPEHEGRRRMGASLWRRRTGGIRADRNAPVTGSGRSTFAMPAGGGRPAAGARRRPCPRWEVASTTTPGESSCR